MKFSEIKSKCKQLNKKLVELSHNENNISGYQIKDVYDFFNICSELIGYEYSEVSSDDATQSVVEKVLEDYEDLYDHYDELEEILRIPESEVIVLVDIKNNYFWMQIPSPTTKQFETAGKKISKWFDELCGNEEAVVTVDEDAVEEIMNLYKKLYEDDHYEKDRDILVDSLIYNLQTECGIDTDTNPKYRRDKIISYLGGK